MTKDERAQIVTRIRAIIAGAEKRGLEYQEEHGEGRYPVMVANMEHRLEALCCQIEEGRFPKKGAKP